MRKISIKIALCLSILVLSDVYAQNKLTQWVLCEIPIENQNSFCPISLLKEAKNIIDFDQTLNLIIYEAMGNQDVFLDMMSSSVISGSTHNIYNLHIDLKMVESLSYIYRSLLSCDENDCEQQSDITLTLENRLSYFETYQEDLRDSILSFNSGSISGNHAKISKKFRKFSLLEAIYQ